MNSDEGRLSERLAAKLGVAAIAATLGWISLWSWRGLIEDPHASSGRPSPEAH